MILNVVLGFRLSGSEFGLRVLWLDLWIWVEALGLNFSGHLDLRRWVQALGIRVWAGLNGFEF